MRRPLAVLVPCLLGCVDIDPTMHLEPSRPECEGTIPEGCLLPWPSSRYLVHDATTETGFRVSIPATAMPSNAAGAPIDPAPFDAWDGFSAMTTMMTILPAPIDASALPPWTEPARSLARDCPTVLVDVETGERIMHFAELEEGEGTDPQRPTLYIRPAARLADDHAYAVAVRGLADVHGSPLAPSDAFRALRDRIPTDAAALESRRAELEESVLGPLEKAGIERASLVQAWGFRTASGASAYGDLLAMRDDALAGPDGHDWACEVTESVEKDGDPDVLRVIRGRLSVPLYLESEARGARLARGGGGSPVRTGTTTTPFTALIPRSALERAQAGGGPTRIVIYGHGLYSSADEEVQRDFMVRFAQDHGAVVFSTDLWGSDAEDRDWAVSRMLDLDGFPALIDRTAQGIVNQLVLVRAAGGCASSPAFEASGAPLADAGDRSYWGNSQGGNLGITLAALCPDVDRFALGVAGISYPIMVPRSLHWPPIEALLKTAYPRRLDRDLLMVMFAMQWDRVEGAPFAPHLLRDPLPGSGVKRVLMQIGLHDAQTPDVASHIAARTIGLPELVPSVEVVEGLATFTGEAPSGLVVYDVGSPPLPLGPVPPSEDTPTHEAVRRDPRAQEQLDLFLRPGGAVVDTCGGPCAPLPGHGP